MDNYVHRNVCLCVIGAWRMMLLSVLWSVRAHNTNYTGWSLSRQQAVHSSSWQELYWALNELPECQNTHTQIHQPIQLIQKIETNENLDTDRLYRSDNFTLVRDKAKQVSIWCNRKHKITLKIPLLICTYVFYSTVVFCQLFVDISSDFLPNPVIMFGTHPALSHTQLDKWLYRHYKFYSLLSITVVIVCKSQVMLKLISSSLISSGLAGERERKREKEVESCPSRAHISFTLDTALIKTAELQCRWNIPHESPNP